VTESRTVETIEEARAFLAEVDLPLVVRPAYTLGGTGGGFIHEKSEFDEAVQRGLDNSPITQVLLERSLVGWKEVEYEVMRDSADTCITVCNMENLDPMGVHTGDSIVVAPSQTLSDKEYQMLRSSALKIIRGLGIEGGCNVQYALDPRSFHYYVIEVNPRVSRSSALASKATGYPIARVAAKVAIGKRLDGDPQPGHRPDPGGLRARPRLLRRQDPALALRQVPHRRPQHWHPDEGHRRGDGNRAHLRSGADEGNPVAGAEAAGAGCIAGG